MQVCTSLQTDNHASTPPLSFLQAGCPSCRPTNSVEALKAHAEMQSARTPYGIQITWLDGLGRASMQPPSATGARTAAASSTATLTYPSSSSGSSSGGGGGGGAYNFNVMLRNAQLQFIYSARQKKGTNFLLFASF